MKDQSFKMFMLVFVVSVISVLLSVSASTIPQSQLSSSSISQSNSLSILSLSKQRNRRKQQQIPYYNNNNNNHNIDVSSSTSIPAAAAAAAAAAVSSSKRVSAKDSTAAANHDTVQQQQHQQQQQPTRTSSVFSFITPVTVEPTAAKVTTTFVVPLQQQQLSQYQHQQITTKSVQSLSSSLSSSVSKIRTNTNTILQVLLHSIIQPLYTLWFTKVPTIIRYIISGNIGNIGLYVCEQIVFHLLGGNKISIINSNDNEHINNLPLIVLPDNLLYTHIDTISFFIGYIVSIPFCHICYSILVYGIHTINTYEKYISTLIGMYSAMITSCIGSTILNTILQKYTTLSKSISFTITLYTFSILNYFIISWICTM